MSATRLGVFICDCGGLIGSVLDLEVLERAARGLPGVALARQVGYACAPDGLDAILAACADGELDRALVAGCPPRLLGPRFQAACRQANRDGDLVELVDIREGCAWAHRDDPERATAKAVDLIGMGVVRATRGQPRQPASAEVVPGALVIGGGVAGMAAALALADAGQAVTLVERAAELGGRPGEAPGRRNGDQPVARTIAAVTRHPRIDVRLQTEVTGIGGTVGRYVASTNGAGQRIEVGAIILATGAREEGPQPDAGVVAHLLGLAQDENGFFPEPRYRLRPQGYADRGIYVCGAAHGPASRAEAELQAISAAFKALRHLRAGRVGNEAPVAVVDEALCTGCASCAEPCPFGAISMHQRAESVDLARVDPLLCTGCGNCVVVCPVKAISQPVDSDAQVLGQIEAALATAGGQPRILVFGCEWSGHAAAELAGARRMGYPVETRLIRVRCSARFDPIHVLWALVNGASGVFLGACGPGDCHYIDGNLYARDRIAMLRQLLTQSGFDPRRLRLEWIVPDDPEDFVTKLSGFADLVRKLGPSPVLSQ